MDWAKIIELAAAFAFGGSLTELLRWLRSRNSSELKDWHDLMNELQRSYDDILDLKKQIVGLTIDNAKKTEIINSLQIEVNQLGQLIEDLKNKLQNHETDF